MLVISESPGGFFPLGLGNPAFVFAVGFKRHLGELRGHGSNFAVGLGQRRGGPTSRACGACSVSEGEAHFALDPPEAISVYLKYLL